MNKIEIPLKKVNIILMLSGSILFVVAGIFAMVNPAKYVTVLFRSPVLIFIVGLAAFLFFGFAVFPLVKKLFQSKMGLIINDEGIIDNSGSASAGMILWKDMEGIDTVNVLSQQFIRITVKNPDEYIKRQTSAITRKMMAANYKKYGSPIQISANTLKVSFDKLYELLQNNFLENTFLTNEK